MNPHDAPPSLLLTALSDAEASAAAAAAMADRGAFSGEISGEIGREISREISVDISPASSSTESSTSTASTASSRTDSSTSAIRTATPSSSAEPDASDSQTLMDAAQTGLYVVRGGLICYANPALAQMLGWPVRGPGGLLGQHHTVLLPPDAVARAETVMARRLAGKMGRQGETRFQRRDGSVRAVRVLARPVRFDAMPAVMCTVVDISELTRALHQAEWNARLLARSEALCRAGSFELAWPEGRLHLSAGLITLLGRPADSPQQNQTVLDHIDWVPPDEQAYVAGIWRNATVGEPFEFQHRVLRADGQRLVVLHRGQLGADGRGVGLLQDVTAQVEAAQRIEDMSTHHEVTGLPNRSWLLDHLDAAMHAARWETQEAGYGPEHGAGFALLAIDIPRIGEVKANMGFGAGDTLTMAIAGRLRQACAGGEAVAQLGDTEFAVVLDHPGSQDKQALRDRALTLQRSLQQPVRLGATDVYAQCVIGIVTFPCDGDSADHVLERAQTARLEVRGGQGVGFFSPESTARALRAMSVESALWRGLERNEFELHYQPQVNLVSGAICGAEALLRWLSPELGRVSPGEFIPIAERSGLIGALGDWVLNEACRQIGDWRRAGLPPVRVAVNLAAAQLQQPDLAGRVQALLLQHGADPASLGVEITESMVMADVDQATATLRTIKAMGVQVSLDDFGTGFSSLRYLSRLPIDVVKVDRSFVRDVTAEAQDVSVTRAIIHMTHGLQMRALAEGVETEGQLSLLVAAGCDECQGHWFSAALPAADFEAMLRAGKRLPERYVRSPGRQRQRTLLLVDDEDNILAALKRLLRRDGYRIVTAASAEQGLQRLAEEEIDVIISDQRMPGMTGVEFLQRAKDLYPNTLRMVLSGYTELQSIIDAVNQGAIYKFLTKPWDDERLRGHVAEAFRQKELADDNRRLAQQVDAANADLASVNDKLARTLEQQREQADLLAASAGRMRDVFDELPIAVLGLDSDATLVFANHEAERLLGQHALLGTAFAHWLPAKLMLQAPAGAQAATVAPTETLRQPVFIAGQHFEALARALPTASAPKGQLLMLLPVPVSAPAPAPANQLPAIPLEIA